MTKSDMHTYHCPISGVLTTGDLPWAAVIETNGVKFYAPCHTREEAEQLHKMATEELNKVQVQAVEMNRKAQP